LYKRLSAYSWIRPWIEFGLDWRKNIDSAVNGAQVVILLISNQSISKKGYSQEIFERTIELIKEIRKNLFYVIPLRLDDCVLPQSLEFLEWRDYFGTNAHEELINSMSKFTGASAVYATENEPTASHPDEFPIQSPADIYENLDWYKYIKIQASSKVDYPFLIRKYHVTNEQYLLFLNSKDYANNFYWTDFPKYDENGTYVGNWGDAGLVWLKTVLKRYPSLLEKTLDWTWREPSLGAWLDFDYRQPNHRAQVTWFEANAYCKWFLRHWQELPDAKEVSNMMETISNLYVRLPLETEFQSAVKYDDLNRIKIDPTLRLHAKRHPGLSLDITATDMLAIGVKGFPDYIKSCDGFLYIDEYTRDLARASYYGSFRPDIDYHHYGFRLLVTELR
jgi:hypothetical protein